METAAIQASLQSTGVGWRSPLSPLVKLHFFFSTLCAETLFPLYFEPMPNLSKTLEGLLTLKHYFSAKFTEYYSIRVRVRVKGE